MNTSARNCIAVFLAALAAGLAAFLLSLLGIFSLDFTSTFLFLAIIIALVLYGIFFRALMDAEKSRLVREAVCCCGKLSIIGAVGTIITAFLTLLLLGGAIRILFDLGVGLVFFFLTLLLAGIGCIITVLYQCRRNDC